MATTKAKKKSAKKAAKKAPAKARPKAAPKMSVETRRQLSKGKRLTIAVKRNASFGSIVKELERRLIIDKGIIGPVGCAPCHSGLDATIIGQEVINPG